MGGQLGLTKSFSLRRNIYLNWDEADSILVTSEGLTLSHLQNFVLQILFFLLSIFKAAAVIAASLHGRMAERTCGRFHRRTCMTCLNMYLSCYFLTGPTTVAHLKIHLCWRQPKPLASTNSILLVHLPSSPWSWACSPEFILFSPTTGFKFLPSFLSFFIPSFHSLSPFLFWLRCLHPKSNFPKPFYVPSAVTPTLSISDRKPSCRYKAVMEKRWIISWKPSSLSTWGSWVASPQSWIHRLKCESEKHCPSHPFTFREAVILGVAADHQLRRSMLMGWALTTQRVFMEPMLKHMPIQHGFRSSSGKGGSPSLPLFCFFLFFF